MGASKLLDEGFQLGAKGADEAAGWLGKGWKILTGGNPKATEAVSGGSKIQKVKETLAPIRKNPATGRIDPLRSLLGIAGLGALGKGGSIILNKKFGKSPADSGEEFDWKKALGGDELTNNQKLDDAITTYIDSISGIGGGGGGGGRGSGAAGMKQYYDFLTGNANTTGGASLAAMQRLANLGAAAATDIKAGSETSGKALQDIYNAAATRAAEGAKLSGVEGSSLTPVSGLAATLPAELQASGSTLRDYLMANQLISAQDAGFMSQLAQQQGTGYANQIARQDELFRRADMARREAERQRQAAASAQASASMRNQALAMGAKLRLEQALQNANKPSPDLSTIDPQKIEDAWADIKSDPRKFALYKAQDITDLNKFANYEIARLQRYQEQ